MLPGVTGDWSVRDPIPHITWWEEEALSHLPAILEGRRPPRYSATYGGLDAFNAQRATATAEVPLASLLQQLDEAYAGLMGYLRALPTSQIENNSRFLRRLRLDTYGHYKLHTRDIREWRGFGPG